MHKSGPPIPLIPHFFAGDYFLKNMGQFQKTEKIYVLSVEFKAFLGQLQLQEGLGPRKKNTTIRN